MSISEDETILRIKWDSKYELGIAIIDAQHQYLVELCNILYEAIMKNQNSDNWREAVKEILLNCVNYVKTHFHDEEVLMKASGYVDYENHKKQHDEFTLNVVRNIQNFNSITLTDALKLDKFLYDWILSHIAFYDKQYVPAVKQYVIAKNG